MYKKELTQKNYAKSYIITVLLISWLVEIVLLINPSVGLKYFSLVMFIPAIIVVIFNKTLHKNEGKKNRSLTNNLNLKSLLFGILYPIFFVIFCAIVVEITGLGKLNFSKLVTLNIISITINILVGMLGAFGEEYGWRGYLLPELTKTEGKVKSTIVVGIVWALFHAPAVFLLANTTGMNNPLLVCFIQTCVVFVFSFSFSYCYYLSESIVSVIIYHSVWNTVNTTILGNIYTNKQGVIEGNLLQINGEGCMGFVVGTLIIYWFVKQLKKSNYVTDTTVNLQKVTE